MSDCDLCAGKCRGHSLGHAEQWEPEPGSRAYQQERTMSDLVERARKLALSGEGSSDELGGEIVTMTLRNPDGPELLEIVTEQSDTITRLNAALERIEAGSKLGTEMFERRVRERKGRLTWYAVNVLQDNLDACQGTAREALSSLGGAAQ